MMPSRRLALLPAGANGGAEYVAALVQVFRPPSETLRWEIVLWEYGQQGFGREAARIALPQLGLATTAPAMAASPAGDHVAVASGAQDEILLFARSELLTTSRLGSPRRRGV